MYLQFFIQLFKSIIFADEYYLTQNFKLEKKKKLKPNFKQLSFYQITILKLNFIIKSKYIP